MTDCFGDGALLFEFARRSQLGEFDSCVSDAPSYDACATRARATNICPDCCIPMEIQGDEYVCGQCRRIAAHAECHITSESHCPSGGKDAKHYGSSDPLRDKCASIYDTLIAQREEYTARLASERGIAYKPGSILFGCAPELAHLVPSTEALMNTATRYIEIQRRATASGTSFVKCGGVKNEVIALLLHLECSKNGSQRSKREIAEMIGLSTDGFSRGQTLLMIQSAAGNFDMEAEETMRENMILSTFNKTIGAYLDAKINAPLRASARDHGEPEPEPGLYYELLCARYMQIMRALIRYAVRHHICPQSQPQTKMVGIIWFITCAMNYRTTIEEDGIDVAACGIKRCTFVKFARAIKKNARLRRIVYEYMPHLRGRMDRIAL